MGRFRLYPALLLLGLGWLVLRGWGAAQGSGDGSPYPPPNSIPSNRAVIATGQPITNTTPRTVVPFADLSLIHI